MMWSTGVRAWIPRILKGVGFLLLQAFLAWLVVEVGLRLVRPHSPKVRTLLHDNVARTPYPEMDSIEELLNSSMIGFSPYTVQYGFTLNSRGLRTREYTVEKPPDALRVIVVGDSFTFASGGLPASQHFTSLLENDLLSQGLPAEVLRFGVPATGPQFQLRLWQLEARRLDPEITLLAFFIGNDFLDEQKVSPPGLDRPKLFFSWLVRHSAAVRAVRNLSRLRGLAANVEEAVADGATTDGEAAPRGGFENPGYAKHFKPDRPSFTEEAFLVIEARRMELFRRTQHEYFAQVLQPVVETLETFAREVDAHGSRLLVMIIPDEFQVDPTVRDAALRQAGETLDAFDPDLPQRALADALRARGIAYLDVLPAFRARQAEGLTLYRPRDTHWNAAGNRLAADLLLSELERLEWLRPPRSEK